MSAHHPATLSSPELRLEPDDEIFPGVRFGRADELLTPAYWQLRCHTADIPDADFINHHGSLEEEVGFCLLGGFGVTLEVANAFYCQLRDEGIFGTMTIAPEEDILELLTTPTMVNGKPQKYRFPNQRAKRIHSALTQLSAIDLDTSNPINFRDQIQSLEGIGPKTASWIARNWLDTDLVAILDIHVLRAGWSMNLFSRYCRLPVDYFTLEKQFIKFSNKLNVRASILDAVMWTDMRMFGSRMVEAQTTH